MAYTIRDDYDPDGELADSSPVAAYLTYVDLKIAGSVGDCGSTLADFERHIEELRLKRS